MLKEAVTRFNHLVSSGSTGEVACRKMNAEFNATFYKNKADVWMNWFDVEAGKYKVQKIGEGY